MRINHNGAGYWVAISRGSDPALAQKLKSAAQKLDKEGVFKAILNRYSK
jgi:hypothetical protein